MFYSLIYGCATIFFVQTHEMNRNPRTFQIKVTVQGMFDFNNDLPAFKEHLRDFLVQIREYTGADDSDLFLEDIEQTLKEAQAKKRATQLTVPGILNPHEIPEEMQD